MKRVMKTVLRTRELTPTDLMLDSWAYPSLANFLFPRFIEELAIDFPWLKTTKSYLKNKGPIQFGARAYLPQVSYVAQLLHSLSPRHIALHWGTLLGAKPGRVLDDPSVDRDLLSGRIEMSVRLVTGNIDFEASFNGPLCFTTGPKSQPSMVAMIIPLPDGKGHILELANFAPKWSPKTNHIPALAAFVSRFLPKLFHTFFTIAYVEDLPFYNRTDTLDQFIGRIDSCNKKGEPSSSHANTMVRSSYFTVHQPFIENGSFSRMMQAAQSLGSQYAIEITSS